MYFKGKEAHNLIQYWLSVRRSLQRILCECSMWGHMQLIGRINLYLIKQRLIIQYGIDERSTCPYDACFMNIQVPLRLASSNKVAHFWGREAHTLIQLWCRQRLQASIISPLWTPYSQLYLNEAHTRNLSYGWRSGKWRNVVTTSRRQPRHERKFYRDITYVDCFLGTTISFSYIPKTLIIYYRVVELEMIVWWH